MKNKICDTFLRSKQKLFCSFAFNKTYKEGYDLFALSWQNTFVFVN